VTTTYLRRLERQEDRAAYAASPPWARRLMHNECRIGVRLIFYSMRSAVPEP
jgi:hypothetical protein